MGILSWWSGNNKSKPTPTTTTTPPPPPAEKATEAAGMNGAMEVNRAANMSVSVFEFGSVGASADKVTLAGYCPVSDDLQPCLS